MTSSLIASAKSDLREAALARRNALPAAERIENITKRLNETVPESGVPMG